MSTGGRGRFGVRPSQLRGPGGLTTFVSAAPPQATRASNEAATASGIHRITTQLWGRGRAYANAPPAFSPAPQ